MKKFNAIIIFVCIFLLPEAQAKVSGVCKFDTQSLSFEGSDQEAAKCLLRPVKIAAAIGPKLTELPPTLNLLVGNAADLPLAKIRAYLAKNNLDEDKIGGSLERQLSKNSGDIGARLFVIHDTSTPLLGNRTDFPADINQSDKVNKLTTFAGPNSVAHVFINRRGEILIGHPLSQGWRATKLETKVVGTSARGLFIHVELIQPRRSNPSGPAGNDQIAPDPGFTEAQYEKLALIYITASVRSGKWLLPGFHAVIDTDISNAHDDPQNFDLSKFDSTIGKVIERIKAITP
jgi:hypothetical protein